jgi:hypothetical protein
MRITPTRYLMTSFTAVCLSVMATGFGQVAHAAQGSSTTLMPPPPAGYSCQPTGNGTVCHRRMDFTHLGSYDATCPQGFDILENGANTEVGRRYYDRDGYLVRRDLHESQSATDPLNIFYSSTTGNSVPYSADFTETDTFAIPGDFDTMSSEFRGNLYTSTAPGYGVLVHDVGVLAYDPAGDVTEDRGPKMLFTGDVSRLCRALSAD